MEAANKNIEETKKEIARKLRRSNKTLWESLSLENQTAIVNEYYDTSSIKRVGIYEVLESNRNISRNLAIIIIGVMLGVLGSIVGSILIKYLPSNVLSDILTIFGFLIVIGLIIHWIDNLSSEFLGEDKVLEYLLEEVERKQ